MNRRQFVSASSAALAVHGLSVAAQPVRAQLKLGCQSSPSNDKHLGYLARYGVRNICGYPEVAEGRLYPSADELKRLRDLADKYGISVDMIALPFLTSSHIDREKHPAIMLANSPERDRDIESVQTAIRNC